MRCRPVELPAVYGAAHDEMVTAPAMVRTVAIRGQRSAKVRCGEAGDLVFYAQFHRRAVKRIHCIIELTQQTFVCSDKAVVIVKAAHRHHEHLAGHTQTAARSDQARNNRQLSSEPVAFAKIG